MGVATALPANSTATHPVRKSYPKHFPSTLIDRAAAMAFCLDRGDALCQTDARGNDELANAADIVGVAASGKERSGSR
jgi:hypothetical protein